MPSSVITSTLSFSPSHLLGSPTIPSLPLPPLSLSLSLPSSAISSTPISTSSSSSYHRSGNETLITYPTQEEFQKALEAVHKLPNESSILPEMSKLKIIVNKKELLKCLLIETEWLDDMASNLLIL